MSRGNTHLAGADLYAEAAAKAKTMQPFEGLTAPIIVDGWDPATLGTGFAMTRRPAMQP